MNKKTIITILLALVAMAGQGQVPLESVKELTMKSEYFNHERQLLIYTPDNYPNFDQTYYDVIYVFDAQDRTMFDLVHCLLNIACKPDPDGGKSTNFIIVGICSPTLWDINYFRNHDYLPMPLHGNTGLFKEGYYYGKSPDLKKFVKNELMPYVKTHYRTSGRSLAIGHSLSASFVLDAMITDDLFDDYIAISPNCCYDEYRLATDIENHQFKNRKAPRFIYTSMSGEIDDGPEYWGDDWKAGWERVSAVLKDKSHFPENTVTSVHTFPGYGHYRLGACQRSSQRQVPLPREHSHLRTHLSRLRSLQRLHAQPDGSPERLHRFRCQKSGELCRRGDLSRPYRTTRQEPHGHHLHHWQSGCAGQLGSEGRQDDAQQ